jgi:hypothetical protein
LTDISGLIQNEIQSALSSLLSKTTEVNSIDELGESNFPENDCVVVSAHFIFAQLDSNWKVIIPSDAATYFLHLMLGEEGEPDLDGNITDDSMDAANEVVSNICGSITTAINGSNFNDINDTKFSLDNKEKKSPDDIKEFQYIYKFNLNIGDFATSLMISFDESMMPHLSSIAGSSEPINDQPEVVEEDLVAEDEEEALEEEALEEEEESKEEEPKEEEEEEEEDTGQTKKSNKLKIILFALIGFLLLLIIVGLVLYFTCFFDPEEKPKKVKKDQNQTTVQAKPEIKTVQRKKHVNFDISMINVKRINRKLKILTKYEIVESPEIEAEKKLEREIAEKERKLKEKQKLLQEFADMNKEEVLKDRNETNITIADQKNQSTAFDEITKKEKVQKYAQIATLKYKLYKSFLDKIKDVDARISICKDSKGRTQIFIGPFKNEKNRKAVIKEINANKNAIDDAFSVELTPKEYNLKCDF